MIIKISEKERINNITTVSLLVAILMTGEIIAKALPKMPNGGSLDIKIIFFTISICFLVNKHYELKVFHFCFIASIINTLIGWFILYQHVIFPFGLILDYFLPQFFLCFLVFFIKKNNFILLAVSFLILLFSFSSYVLSGIFIWNVPLYGSIIYNISWYWPMLIILPIILLTTKQKLKL